MNLNQYIIGVLVKMLDWGGGWRLALNSVLLRRKAISLREFTIMVEAGCLLRLIVYERDIFPLQEKHMHEGICQSLWIKDFFPLINRVLKSLVEFL